MLSSSSTLSSTGCSAAGRPKRLNCFALVLSEALPGRIEGARVPSLKGLMTLKLVTPKILILSCLSTPLHWENQCLALRGIASFAGFLSHFPRELNQDIYWAGVVVPGPVTCLML